MSAKEKSSQKEEESTTDEKYPKAIYFIIGNEFCERFSFYGLRTLLTIFLTKELLYSKNNATIIFHVFSMACYFSPMFGAYIADSYLGKFKTILYISIVYCFGNIMVAVASVPFDLKIMSGLTMVGLTLIALGTGGIKPCVAAFGGDQFGPNQEKRIQRFFSFFYLAINLGSLFSTFLSPILREQVHCFGSQSCFPLAFGIPAILMMVSLAIFLLGKPLYKKPVRTEENVVTKVCKCICHAIARKLKTQEKNKAHWLDYAEDKYEKKFIGDVKTVLHVMLLYLPLPVFWALFDQQGSRWTLQALRLEGYFYGYNILPDQMQFVNPLLVIILIPLFEYCVYPLLKKGRILTKPLQRITVGGLLAAAAFVVAGFLELKVEGEIPDSNPSQSETLILNNSPCIINITGSDFKWTVQPQGNHIWKGIPIGDQQLLYLDGCKNSKEYNFTSFYPAQLLAITIRNNNLNLIQVEDMLFNDDDDAKVRIAFNMKGTKLFQLRGQVKNYVINSSFTGFDSIGISDYISVMPGKYKIYSLNDGTNDSYEKLGEGDFRKANNYILAAYKDPETEKVFFQNEEGLRKINVHILNQVPQYILITVGEIMFSITGLEFSYSQAPASMKSVLQATWLMSVAVGNVIVIIVAKANFFDRQYKEFFMFAALMTIDILIFAIMAYFYKYVDSSESEDEVDSTTKKSPGQSNSGYEDEDTRF